MSELEDLKSLLFGAEKKALESLSDRVRLPETRAADVADVLPEALRLSHQHSESLVTELREPVIRSVKRSFEETPQDYVDVLYPVMGPAIRKSITQALKAFTQRINQTVEYSLSIRGLSWRLQAFRSGIPFSDFVMQRTLQYRVEQAYLISRENGLLVAHVHHEASQIKDGDAVSAMFTAIQDFVKESFSPDPNSRLETADMGEFTLWALHGPHAVIVCVIRGVPPQTLRAKLSVVLEHIHFRYSEALRVYSGDAKTVSEIESQLKQVLEFQDKQNTEEKPHKLWALIAILIVVLISYFGQYCYDRWQRHQELKGLETILTDTPGIYLGNIGYKDGQYVLQGLRDPLSVELEHIAQKAGIEKGNIRSDFRPYQSLDPEMVFLRAKILLEAPATVSLQMTDGKLIVAGSASSQWIDRLNTLIESGRINMPLIADRLDSNDDHQREKLIEEIANLKETEFYFSEGTTLVDADIKRLDSYANELRVAITTAAALDAAMDISVVGLTDSTGNADYNEALSRERALIVVKALIAAGVSPSLIQVREMESNALTAGRRSALVKIEYLDK